MSMNEWIVYYVDPTSEPKNAEEFVFSFFLATKKELKLSLSVEILRIDIASHSDQSEKGIFFAFRIEVIRSSRSNSSSGQCEINAKWMCTICMLVIVRPHSGRTCSATMRNIRTARSRGIVNNRNVKATTQWSKVIHHNVYPPLVIPYIVFNIISYAFAMWRWYILMWSLACLTDLMTNL